MADVFLLPFKNYNMFLLIQWLITFGDIIWNFSNLTVSFKMGEKEF